MLLTAPLPASLGAEAYAPENPRLALSNRSKLRIKRTVILRAPARPELEHGVGVIDGSRLDSRKSSRVCIEPHETRSVAPFDIKVSIRLPPMLHTH